MGHRHISAASTGFVSKYDRHGQQLWSMLLGSHAWADALALDAGGEVYVTLHHSGAATRLVKLSACGEEAWRLELNSGERSTQNPKP